MRQGADKRSRYADPRMLAKPIQDRGSMRGLFHRAALPCFYRTSGRSLYKYNSSISPIESWHAVKKSPAMSIRSTSLAYAGPSLPVSAIRLQYLPTLSQLPWPCRSRSRPSGQPLCQELAEVLSPHWGRVLTITSVQTYQRHHRQGKDQCSYRQFQHSASYLSTVSAPRRTTAEFSSSGVWPGSPHPHGCRI